MPRAQLGRLPNAPLAYVLAQVRFDPILAMEKLVPDLQSAFRADYPRFQAMQGLSIIMGVSGPMQTQSPTTLRWDLANDSNHHGLIIQQNSITFHTTDYTTYEDFSKTLGLVLTKSQDVVPDMFVRRIGLRYVDLIVPDAGENANDYVQGPLRCDPGPLPGLKSYQGITAIGCEMEQGQLNVKFYVTAKGATPNQTVLPPDLEPMPLVVPPVVQRAQSAGRPLGVLDTDRFVDNLDQRYNAESLSARFLDLHGDISLAFRQFTSDHARKVWSQQQ